MKTIIVAKLVDYSTSGLHFSNAVLIILNNLTVIDWLFILVFIGAITTLIIIEIRYNAITDYLIKILESKHKTFILLSITFLFCWKPVFGIGEPYMVDAPAHISRSWFSYLNLVDGYLPTFTNYYHFGFSLFSHYGFLYYYIVAFANIILRDIILTTKIITFILGYLSVAVFYKVGTNVFKSQIAGFFLPVLIILSNYVFYLVQWSGVLLYPLILIAFGLIIISFENLLEKKWTVYTSVFVTSLSVLILVSTHLGYAAQFLLYFSLYAILRYFLFYHNQHKRLALYIIGNNFVAGLLSVYVFLPTISDIKDVNFFKAFPFTDINTYEFWKVHFIGAITPRPFYSDNYDYMGISLIILTIISSIILLKNKSKWLFLCVIMFLFSLLISGYQRNAIFFNITLSFLVVAGLTIIKNISQTNINKVIGFAFLAIIIDIGVCNNFMTYNTTNGFEHVFFTSLEKNTDISSFGVIRANSLHSGNNDTNNVFISPWLKVVGHRIIQPNAIMLEANKNALYQWAISHDLLNKDLIEGEISPTTVNGLRLIGVKYLTFNNATAYYVPKGLRTPTGVIITDNYINICNTPPFVFSKKTLNINTEPGFKSYSKIRDYINMDDESHTRYPYSGRENVSNYLKLLINSYDLNTTTNISNTIFIDDKKKIQNKVNGREEIPVIDILGYKVDSQTVSYKFKSNTEGYIQLPVAYYSWQSVTIDDRPVAFYKSAMQTIVIPVDSGTHSIKVGPAVSISRHIGFIITISSLTVFSIIFVLATIKRKRKSIYAK